jgi:hypothetical protein
MVGCMSLQERADRDFALARRKARLGARLRRNDAAWQGLLCFEEVRTFLGGAGGFTGAQGRCRPAG